MKSYFETVLDIVEISIEELEELQLLFPDHPCKKHFHYGKPRLHKYVIKQKEFDMSASQSNSLIYLGAASTVFTLTALDQYGFPYTGADLSATTASSDAPANVSVSLGTFTNGVAPLTLNQAGGEGTANVTVSNGAVTLVQPVESYVPVLNSFTLTAPPAPAPAAPTTSS